MYRCDTDTFCKVKPRFWGVEHAESQAKSNIDGDITAAKIGIDFKSSEEFRQAVTRHLDWRCRIPSSFISVFDDESHAINWAIRTRKRQERAGDRTPVYIQEMITAALSDVCVLNLGLIVDDLDISCEGVEHEYLIQNMIPRHAAGNEIDVTALENQGEWQ